MSTFPSFDDFYKEVHGWPPFPWQSRLAKEVAVSGWPKDIGVPTGLGKTACIDIAVWNLARDASENGTKRTAPTRLWYVVNRRLLVDGAHEHALDLQTRLQEATSGAIFAVAQALRDAAAINWSSGPLHVCRLRGGVDRGHRAPDPSCPAIMLATVPMFGSRLLFNGYGVSRGMKPIDAALAGTDSVVLLDEAHLAAPLQKTLSQIEECREADEQVLSATRSKTQLVNLTATGAGGDEVFDLDDADRSHGLIQQRLTAAKPALLRSVADRQMHREIAAEALELLGRLRETHPDSQEFNPGICVFVNTAGRAPLVARELGKLIRKEKLDASLITLTGRMRGVDSANIVSDLMGGGHSVKSGRTSELDKPLFVVATQTLEVGADLDFDAMVTETCGVRSLVQRLGRLNRLGERNWAQATIMHGEGLKTWPVYGEEPAEVFEKLISQTGLEQDPIVQLGPGVISEVLGVPNDPDVQSPELLPNHLWAWAKTSELNDDWKAPVDPFISGEQDDLRRVSVIWRKALPKDRSLEDSAVPVRLLPTPHSDEAIEIPIFEARKEFEKVGRERPMLLSSEDDSLSYKSWDDVGPGDTLVLPVSAGNYLSEHGWSPGEETEVEDVCYQRRYQAVLCGSELRRLHALGVELVDESVGNDYESEVWQHIFDLADLVQQNKTGKVWVSRFSDEKLDEAGDGAASELSQYLKADVGLRETPYAPVTFIWPAPTGVKAEKPLIDRYDGMSTGVSFEGDRALLEVHLRNVGDKAKEIAMALGLRSELVEALADSGHLHDTGKADPRFQLVLDAPVDEALAKSRPGASGSNAHWPRGTRHEAVSVALFDEWLKESSHPESELVKHLVASHHGHARPLVPIPDNGGSIEMLTEVLDRDVKIVSDLMQRDWDQPTRFKKMCERFGYWGLALLEAILRQSDHSESSEVENDTVNYGEKI